MSEIGGLVGTLMLLLTMFIPPVVAVGETDEWLGWR